MDQEMDEAARSTATVKNFHQQMYLSIYYIITLALVV